MKIKKFPKNNFNLLKPKNKIINYIKINQTLKKLKNQTEPSQKQNKNITAQET